LGSLAKGSRGLSEELPRIVDLRGARVAPYVCKGCLQGHLIVSAEFCFREIGDEGIDLYERWDNAEEL